MDVRKHMENKSFTSIVDDGLERISNLMGMLDDVQKTIKRYPEINTDEGLRDAYKAMTSAFKYAADAEWNEIRKRRGDR